MQNVQKHENMYLEGFSVILNFSPQNIMRFRLNIIQKTPYFFKVSLTKPFAVRLP